MKLQGKVAVVTGGAGGIGKAIARRFAEEGARVVIADLNAQASGAAAAEIGRDALCFSVDVARPDSIRSMVANAVKATGGIDILVNNAGIFDLAPVLDVTEASWDLLFSVNAKGMFFTLQAVARHMIEAGRPGKIVNVSSMAGRRGDAFGSVYCATKACVISLTQSAGQDLIRHRINVNGIAPGVVDTPMWDKVDALFAKYENRPLGEKRRLAAQAVPFGRMGLPEDHAGAAVFLASPESDYVVAQTLNVDGGMWMS